MAAHAASPAVARRLRCRRLPTWRQERRARALRAGGRRSERARARSSRRPPPVSVFAANTRPASAGSPPALDAAALKATPLATGRRPSRGRAAPRRWGCRPRSTTRSREFVTPRRRRGLDALRGPGRPRHRSPSCCPAAVREVAGRRRRADAAAQEQRRWPRPGDLDRRGTSDRRDQAPRPGEGTMAPVGWVVARRRPVACRPAALRQFVPEACRRRQGVPQARLALAVLGIEMTRASPRPAALTAGAAHGGTLRAGRARPGDGETPRAPCNSGSAAATSDGKARSQAALSSSRTP